MQPYLLNTPDLLSAQAKSLLSLPVNSDGDEVGRPVEASDRFTTSFDTGNGFYILERRISIEIEYQSLRSMRLESGEVVFEKMSLRFQAVEIYLEVGGLGSNNEGAGPGGLFDVLRDYFSPERTANRIANFAIGRFQPGFENGTEKAMAERERFRNLILPAVRQGADQAASVLAGLPEEILGIADRVYDLVANLFERFVAMMDAHAQAD